MPRSVFRNSATGCSEVLIAGESRSREAGRSAVLGRLPHPSQRRDHRRDRHPGPHRSHGSGSCRLDPRSRQRPGPARIDHEEPYWAEDATKHLIDAGITVEITPRLREAMDEE